MNCKHSIIIMSEKTENLDVNDRLRQLIFDLKLNASSFAKQVGVSPGVMNNIVGGRLSKPSFEILEKIILKTGVSSHWLITGHGEPFLPIVSSVTVPSTASDSGREIQLQACRREVELLQQRLTDKDELIQSLKAQIALHTQDSSSSQTA